MTGMKTLDRAVFLDKDGTLLVNVPYNVDPAQMQLTPGAGEGLRLLQDAGYKLFIVSNQSGVARGLFTEVDLLPVRRRLESILAEEGVKLSGFYYCPHHPQGVVRQYSTSCFCRKPSPGMLFQAAREHGIDLGASWIIGDILDDVECGRRANCRTVLLTNGNETEWKPGSIRAPHYSVPDLLAAAWAILDKSPDQVVKTKSSNKDWPPATIQE